MWLLLLGLAAANDLVSVRTITHLDRPFTVVEVPPDPTLRIDLWGQGDGQPRTVDAAEERLGSEGRVLLMATNAGMYRENRRPVGLHVERGAEHAPVVREARGGNFGLLPNGIFYVDASGPGVVTTPEWTGVRPDVWLATQSGPILVRNGELHPAFQADSTSLRLRSGVGVRPDGTVVFGISEGLVRFHDFATLFRDVLGCPDALFLDGTVSTMVAEGRDGASHRIGRFSGVLTVSAPQPRAEGGT